MTITQDPDGYVEPKGIIEKHHVEPTEGYAEEIERGFLLHYVAVRDRGECGDYVCCSDSALLYPSLSVHNCKIGTTTQSIALHLYKQ